MLAAARDNARAAGVADRVTWQRADVARLAPALIDDIAARRVEAGLLLSNPPYGERLDAHDLDDLYGAIAATCQRFRGWRAGFLVGSPRFEAVLGLTLGTPRIKPLANANLRAYFYLYDL